MSTGLTQYHLVGTLTLTSHARQTAPDGTSGGESKTIKTWLWGPDGDRHEVPFITANSQRGLLRRHAADIILDRLADKAQLVPRQIFQILSRGAHSRDGIGVQATAEAMIESGQHVFAGLYGGGPYMVHSRYSIGALLPQIAWCRHLLHPSLQDTAIPAERLRYTDEAGNYRDIPLTTKIILAPRDDLQAGKGSKYIENYQASVDEWLGAVASGRAAKADQAKAKADAKARGDKKAPEADGARSVDTSNFTLNECILPGTRLQYWMRFRPQTTEAQLGLQLMAIRNWANTNQLGGNSAQGFGRFEANLALYRGTEKLVDNIFGIADHATAYELTDALAPFVDAAMKEIDEITVDQLKRVFPYELVDERANKAAEKKAKAKAKAKGEDDEAEAAE